MVSRKLIGYSLSFLLAGALLATSIIFDAINVPGWTAAWVIPATAVIGLFVLLVFSKTEPGE